MSVTFYDPQNPTKYDEEYNVIGGGYEANFSNMNARLILEILGFNDPVMYGNVPASEMLGILEQATVAVLNFSNEEKRDYLVDALHRIRMVAEEAKANGNSDVCWG